MLPELRLFRAIELSAAARASAYDHLARLRARVPHVNATWERAEKLQLTLKFLGALEAARVAALTEAAAQAAAGVSPSELTISALAALVSLVSASACRPCIYPDMSSSGRNVPLAERNISLC